MTFSIPGMHTVTKVDIPVACSVLSAAFHDDPLWKRILEGEKEFERKLESVFEIPLRYTMRYGSVLAPSKNLEGLMGILPGRFSDMSVGRIIRCGALLPALRMGMRIAMRMQPVGRILPSDRKRHMNGRPFVYLFVIGVNPACQKKGFGGTMLRALVETCSNGGMAVYLETETEENAAWYEKAGFKLLKKITLDRLNVPMWEMVFYPD